MAGIKLEPIFIISQVAHTSPLEFCAYFLNKGNEKSENEKSENAMSARGALDIAIETLRGKVKPNSELIANLEEKAKGLRAALVEVEDDLDRAKKANGNPELISLLEFIEKNPRCIGFLERETELEEKFGVDFKSVIIQEKAEKSSRWPHGFCYLLSSVIFDPEDWK